MSDDPIGSSSPGDPYRKPGSSEPVRTELRLRPEDAVIRLHETRHHRRHLDCYPTRPEVTVGRSPSVDLSLDDASVARQHCRLLFLEEGVVLEDIHSTSGVFLEPLPPSTGDKAQRAVLCEGDQLHIGTNVILRVERRPDGLSLGVCPLCQRWVEIGQECGFCASPHFPQLNPAPTAPPARSPDPSLLSFVGWSALLVILALVLYPLGC